MGKRYYVACVMVVIAILFFQVIAPYAKISLIPKIPILIVCGFTMQAAIISIFSGLMWQVVLQKNRQDFEVTRYALCQERKNHQM